MVECGVVERRRERGQVAKWMSVRARVGGGGRWWRRERGGGERRAATRPRTSRATCARTLAGKDNGTERRADVGKGRRKNRARKGGREVVEQEIEAKKASIGWSMEAESERQALHIPCASLLTSQSASLHTLPPARATHRYLSMELHRELTTQSSNNLTRSTRDNLQVWISCACLTRGKSKLTQVKAPLWGLSP